MSQSQIRPRETVGASLMNSAETEAVVAWLQDHHSDVSVQFRDCYYKVERDRELEFDLEAISIYLGAELDTETFLVSLSSYYGRIAIEEKSIRIVSEITAD